jgi:predicted O-linked N-acetylglucosamine transferase (SPINDLY family)
MFSHKIKIGYISKGFENNVIANFIIGILNSHNREHFEIHIFTYHKINKQINTSCTHVHILSQSIIENANLIYSNNIDILIDLDTFIGENLDILSKNPAPIQITYIGYPNSTGLDFIHYRISDTIADHHESSQYNKERLIKLPGCFLLYQSILQTDFVDNYNYSCNKPYGVILAAINNEIKNGEESLFAWKQIMQKTHCSCKLLIKINSRDNINTKIEYYSRKLAVEPDRLIIVPYTDNSSYVNLFQNIDVLLDTFPYSGTTTSCNALYNSTPIVTLYNKHFHCHNVTSSILIHSGFPELVTYTIDDYVNKVVYLCNHVDEIHQYKRTIHSQFTNTMNPESFIFGYEKALTNVYIERFPVFSCEKGINNYV